MLYPVIYTVCKGKKKDHQTNKYDVVFLNYMNNLTPLDMHNPKFIVSTQKEESIN